MKKRLLMVLLFGFIAVIFSGAAEASVKQDFKHKYVGSKACAQCHLEKETGNQYLKWLSGRHSHAYWRLAGEWAKFLALQREEYKDIKEPQKEQRCLKCHYTGAELPPEAFAPTFHKEEGVGCESCHGPGSTYIELSIMKDRKKFLENGGIIPTEATCKQCHRDNRFKYDEWVKKILHPI